MIGVLSKLGVLRRAGGATVALAAALFLFGGAGSAQAQFLISITADENGNGNLSNSNGFSQALTSSLLADPGPGGLASALTYDLLNPPGLVAGDLLIDEFGTTTLGDVIRFNAPAGAPGSMVFYSLDSDGDLADTGGPSADYTNVATLTEDVNGQVFYTPTAGEPGFVAGAGGPVVYTITSDDPVATPEPASMLLFGCGLAGLGLARRRKK